MNKIFKNIVIPLFLITLSIALFHYNKELIHERETIIKEFNKKGLLDASGKVNLSEITTKKDNIVSEVEELLSESNLTINDFEKELTILKEKNDELTENYENLNTKVDKLKSDKDNLIAEYTILNSRYEEVLREREEEIRRNTIMINGVPTINQYPNYPTGCESVALAILLRYYGVNVSPAEIIASLKKGDKPYLEDGIKYGGNPHLEFIGDPYDGDSFGVYNDPISEVAENYKTGAILRSGMPFSEVLDLVKNGHPVIVWTSMNLTMPYISNSWVYKPTGEKINWKAQEHAVVIVGYNDNSVIISDPLRGQIRYQTRSTFESRYNYYGRLAVYY